jgi:hypothetical protein
MKRLTATAIGIIALACGNIKEDAAQPDAGGGTGGAAPTWIGAPCEECDLATQVPKLVGAGSDDCGEIAVDAGNADAVACAHAAFDERRPFHLMVEHAGIDSSVRTVWFFDAGKLNVVAYDSNVCGGGGSCETLGCGPMIVSRTCVDPVKSSAPGIVFDCGATADARSICRPADGPFSEGPPAQACAGMAEPACLLLERRAPQCAPFVHPLRRGCRAARS